MKAPLCATSAASVTALAAGLARADVPFVDRPVTLSPLHVSADIGVGFGQFEGFEPDPNNLEGPPLPLGNKVGFGSNLEGAVGLPFVGEVGVRLGYRFGSVAANAQADRFGRLFDPVVNQPGNDAFANPELALRRTVFAMPAVEVALGLVAVLPTASNSDFALTPGVPVRVHLPGFARIDTGLYLPVTFTSPPTFGIQVPAQLFFQVGDSFFGPLTGLRYIQNGDAPDPQIIAGVGGGHTLGGVFDLKAQVYTSQINDVNWAKHVGGGIGVGLRMR